jgi:hypothetical protein
MDSFRMEVLFKNVNLIFLIFFAPVRVSRNVRFDKRYSASVRVSGNVFDKIFLFVRHDPRRWLLKIKFCSKLKTH